VIAHEHSHLTFPARARESRVALRRALLLTGLFMLVEVAAVVSLLAVYLVAVPANLGLTFGYYRMEVLAALANGILLLGITAWIVVEAVQRLARPAAVRPVPMLPVAAAGLAVNLIALLWLRPQHGQEMLAQVQEVLLEQFDLAHTTLQIEGERFAEVKAHV